MSENTILGILAHVDAGKTTLSEALLYKTGVIKEYGRVDNQDAFLDTDEMEKKRGITIFSKNAELSIEGRKFTLVDTPGHVDFSAEMERTLQILDYAILVISGSDLVTGHTMTLWRLLKAYNIPVFIFVNKMDQPGNEKAVILEELRKKISDYIIDFSDEIDYEQIATSDEAALNQFLENDYINKEKICELIDDRKIFPCFFGSALKVTGIDEFIKGLSEYAQPFEYDNEFGARVYKIGRDAQGNRLTYMKITGGELVGRQQIEVEYKDAEQNISTEIEKVNQIRIYSGEKFQAVNSVKASNICAVTGLNHTYAGQGLGKEAVSEMPLIEPILSYKLILPEEVAPRQFYPDIKKLEEEIPELNVDWNDRTEEISVKIMGKVQLEILNSICERKYGFSVGFDRGSITYKESIKSSVIGVGHFEPLRHYAEVHLLMEPGENGSGIIVKTDCKEDILAKNWQRLIVTHLKERNFVGVLTGAQLTDVVITVINGRAHNKHTEGGDFRQATYRAVRQGLMQAESILLEPYYSFVLKVDNSMIGKIMTDIEQLCGKVNAPEIIDEIAILKGIAPVATLREYQENLSLHTKGKGSMEVSFAGYFECHNSEEIIEAKNYNPEADIFNSPDSVFCDRGAGFIVPWHQVYEYMHVFDKDENDNDVEYTTKVIRNREFDYAIGVDEIDEIINRTYNSNQSRAKAQYKKRKPVISTKTEGAHYIRPNKKLYIMDGYNMIFANKELEELSKVNINSAKDKLVQLLSNYQAINEIRTIVVFDGYKAKGNKGSEELIDNVEVIHTKENETADAYIEKFTIDNNKNYSITVVSSDNLIQQISRGHNCLILSSREMFNRMEADIKEFNEQFGVK